MGGKSIWDWLEKIYIPLAAVLAGAVAAGVFGYWQTQLANLQHQHDQQLAQDQERAGILQTYIGNIQDLLLNHKLSNSKPEDPIRQLAKVQTLTSLRRLDADRNGTVLRFLRDAHLIGIRDVVINLADADLSGANLSRIDLTGIDLTGANLSNATLNGADLSGTILNRADLSGAHLKDANLSGAYLSAGTLTDADMNGARLTNATLTDAHLDGANLSGASLPAAYLSGANLDGANLSGANLGGADLSGAVLSNANLNRADLSDANLTYPLLTQQQLDSVYSCTNAILPTLLKCDHHPKITLTYWYTETPAEWPVILKLIRQFEHENPNISINAVYRPFYQTRDSFITAAQAGKAPDILRSDVSWVALFASQHYLLNIDSYISPSDLSDYRGSPLGRASLGYDEYNGHLYGLPQVADFLALLYNKADIASPPATMNNFESDAKKVIQGKAPRTPEYGFETNGNSYYVLPFLWAFGGGMLDRHNTPMVNSPGSKAGLQFLLQLQNRDKAMPPVAGVTDMVQDFMTGKTAMIFGGPWDVLRILGGPAFNRNPGKLGIAGIPTCPADTRTCHAGQTGSPLGGQSYVISAGTAHPVEAYRFLSFMSQTPRQVKIAEENHTLPTRESAYQDKTVSSNPVIKGFNSITQTARARPVIPQDAYLFDAFDADIRSALEGVQDPGNALNAVAAAWNQLLASS